VIVTGPGPSVHPEDAGTTGSSGPRQDGPAKRGVPVRRSGEYTSSSRGQCQRSPK